MKRLSDILWPLVALAAMAFSFWLLFNDRDLRDLNLHDVMASLSAIPPLHFLLSTLSTLIAYAALAWYDRIGLAHLGRVLSWIFLSVVSFTSYALSHNLGFSMFTGGLIRYRAYSTKGLTVADIAVLTAFCSFTFALGTVVLGGLLLTFLPEIILRLNFLLPIPIWGGRLIGIGMLSFIILYVAGSTLGLKPLSIRSFKLAYPRLEITLRQLIAAPIELLGAAGIIYFALPGDANPGYLVVLGVFLASFSAGLLSHAPGGLGVLEFVFLKAMPDVPTAKVAAALLIFRMFYLILPLILSLIAVFFFEREQILKAARAVKDADRPLAGLRKGLAAEAEELKQDAAALRANKQARP